MIVTASGFAALELATGLAALVAIGPQRITWFVLACGLATALLAGLLATLLRPRRGRGGGHGPSGGPPGGGGGSGPGGGGPSPEPVWWPEFERQLRDHIRSRDHSTAGAR